MNLMEHTSPSVISPYSRLFTPGSEVEFEYVNANNDQSHRVVTIEGISDDGQNFWGWCHLRQERRDFKRERIVPFTARLWDGQRVVDAYTGEVLIPAKDDTLIALRNRAEGWTL